MLKQDIKEIENILELYGNIPEYIQNLNKEVNEIIKEKGITCDTLQSSKITNLPRSKETSNPVLSAVITIVDRYLQRITEIKENINELMDLQEQINKIYYSEKLTLEERRIIDLVYFKRYGFDRIPQMVRYSRSQCFKIRGSAIQKIYELMKTS
jgi:DNA-directed RNA polymerase specialized sigma subunit